MIRQVKLEYFRQHLHRTFDFVEGLNAIKGANEAGKTTLIEAVLYALFGAKTLRDPLADVVTWGHKETDLRVELIIDIHGRLFHFSRGKSGAEANYDGGKVTGQTEVSSFAAEILGSDANMMSRLMLATQNNLRGALEEGPKAVATQIETLADFDLFQRIIDQAAVKWTLGSTLTVEDRIKTARGNVKDVPRPDYTDLDEGLADLAEAILKAMTEMDTLTPQQRVADAALESARTVRRMFDQVNSDLIRAMDTLKQQQGRKEALETKASAKVAVEELPGLRSLLVDAASRSKELAVYQEFKALTYPSDFWEGSSESLNEATESAERDVEHNDKQLREANKTLTGLERDRQELKNQFVSTLNCPTCGHELKDRTVIEQRNKDLLEKVDQADKAIEKFKVIVRECERIVTVGKQAFADLRKVVKAGHPTVTFALVNHDYVNIDRGFYPPRLTWKGESPLGRPTPNLKGIQAEIDRIEAEEKARVQAEGEAKGLATAILDSTAHVQRLTGQLNEFGELPSVEALKEEAQRIGNRIAVLRVEIDRNKDEVVRSGKVRSNREATYRAAIDEQTRLIEQVESYELELKQLEFNNALLKKIKAARPVIADKLWSMVLTSVSTMFSQMRGEKSVVTKDKDGFKVNGKSVTSFSGSTLDILGLAIRVALVKTFLPNTTFMVLDEPQAACDDDRTNSVLAFLTTVGFHQVLLVSHESQAEAVSDHVVEV